MSREPSIDIEVPTEHDLGDTLLVGVPDIGLAGLTAVDFLTTHVDTNQIGHVKTRNLPDIAPFTEGKPRRPMRLYNTQESDLTVLISEVFLPVWVADLFSDTVFDWVSTEGIEEITMLYGVPFPHREADHAAFHVGTDGFREKHFTESRIDPLPGGFFDGVVAEFITRGLDDGAPPVGALVTPAHFPGPDFEGATELIEGLETIYDIKVDETELKERSEQMRQYYQELGQRMQTLRDEDQPLRGRDFPEDSMFM